MNCRSWVRLGAVLGGLVAACGPATPVASPSAPAPTGAVNGRSEQPPVLPQQEPLEEPKFPKACSNSLYPDDRISEFHLELEPQVWDYLLYEHSNWRPIWESGGEVEQYRPVLKLTHEGKSVENASVRLRGNESAWHHQPKLQFQIAFNQQDPDGRFRGVRKLVFDSAWYNETYLRDRLAMSVFRDAGLIAPCVNHARVYVNGEYYGLYASLEKVDREFLERNFKDPSGNLWKKGFDMDVLKTNEDENPDTSAKDRFWAVTSMSELESIADVEGMVRAWAVEAMLPDEDGYWAGGKNFYWYEHPEKGFTYIPWDFDLGFDRLLPTTDPLTWDKRQREKNPGKFYGHPHVELALADPKWRAVFVDQLEKSLTLSPAATLQARIDTWAAQIRESAETDRFVPWTFEKHLEKVEALRNFVGQRDQALRAWVTCVRENGLDSTPCK